jgi:hypothetical protein
LKKHVIQVFNKEEARTDLLSFKEMKKIVKQICKQTGVAPKFYGIDLRKIKSLTSFIYKNCDKYYITHSVQG